MGNNVDNVIQQNYNESKSKQNTCSEKLQNDHKGEDLWKW
jgi:hypothetical protein